MLKRLLAIALADRPAFFRATAWQIGMSLAALPFAASVQYLFDVVIPYAQSHQQAWPILAYAGACLTAWPMYAWISVRSYASAGMLNRTAVARIRRMVVDRLQHLSVGYYTKRGAGAVANQLTVDMGRVEGFLGTVGNGFFPNLTLGIGATTYLFFVNPVLAVAALLGVPLQMWILKAMSAKVAAHQRRVQAAGEDFAAKIVEYVAGMRVMKGLGTEDLAAADLGRSIDEIRESGIEAALTSRWLGLWTQFAWYATTTLIYTLGAFGIAGFLGVPFTVGQVIAFIALYGYVQAGAGAVTGFIDSWQSAKPAVDKLMEILDSDEVEDYLHPKQTVRLDGAMQFHQVDFTYPGTEKPALSNLELTIPKGQRIGLVGETGAGKSTFVDLVLGFWRPGAGTITWDGLGLEIIGRRQLRRQAAVMAQEAFLWNTTIRENIRLGRPGASDAEVEDAARKAQALPFIQAAERGFETPCGERGARLSGGQRQRVALARLFLRDPRIIVLDEPTSALDLETEAKLQIDLDALTAGRTTFIIAHRLSTLRSVDRILVFHQGRIVEDGTPAELLAKEGGRFRHLHDLSG